MRIVVFGAGAIGSALAAQVLLAKHDVAVVARGQHLAKIQADGLSFTSIDGEKHELKLEAGDEHGVPPGDVVLVTLKSYALAAAAPGIRRVCKQDGLVVFLQNGLPWWYFRGLKGPFGDRPLPTLDPGGILDASFPSSALAGGVVTLAATLAEPGRVAYTAGRGLSIGRADCAADDRLTALAGALNDAGFDVELPGDPRPAVWTKLIVNVAINGVAALTGANIGAIWDDDELRPLVHELADEVMQLASALGCPVTMDLEQRRRGAARTHKSSTLQDIEAGRPIEHEALFGALLPIATELNLPIPKIRTISALLRRRAIESGCMPK